MMPITELKLKMTRLETFTRIERGPVVTTIKWALYEERRDVSLDRLLVTEEAIRVIGQSRWKT